MAIEKTGLAILVGASLFGFCGPLLMTVVSFVWALQYGLLSAVFFTVFYGVLTFTHGCLPYLAAGAGITALAQSLRASRPFVLFIACVAGAVGGYLAQMGTLAFRLLSRGRLSGELLQRQMSSFESLEGGKMMPDAIATICSPILGVFIVYFLTRIILDSGSTRTP